MLKLTTKSGSRITIRQSDTLDSDSVLMIDDKNGGEPLKIILSENERMALVYMVTWPDR